MLGIPRIVTNLISQKRDQFCKIFLFLQMQGAELYKRRKFVKVHWPKNVVYTSSGRKSGRGWWHRTDISQLTFAKFGGQINDSGGILPQTRGKLLSLHARKFGGRTWRGYGKSRHHCSSIASCRLLWEARASNIYSR